MNGCIDANSWLQDNEKNGIYVIGSIGFFKYLYCFYL